MASAKIQVATKRAYEPAAPDDGERILIDRLWPRGVTKERARIDLWLKDVAPSRELRTWYGHDDEKYDEFRRRYRAELTAEPGASALALLREHAARGPVTLIFAAKSAEHCNASALRELLVGDAQD